jgi:hypothetical protein
MSHLRAWARFSFLLVILSFPFSAHAAGAYAQSFDSNPPPGWALAEDTWSATNGYYANATTQPFRAIAYFADRRWATDFTYSLQMYSDLRGTGNHKVGVVFNFVDEMNYLEVAINMLGNVELNQVSGGVRTALQTGQSGVPAIDTWFDVAIVRSGNNKVKVRVGNEDVLNYDQLASPPVGYIGVLSQFNRGRFDDVKVTPVVFLSGFGTGVNVTQPTCVGPTGGVQKYQLNLTGTESATGTVWPPVFWGAPSVVLMNTILTCDPAYSFSDYLDARLKSVTSHNGQSTRVLSNTVKNVTLQADGTIARLGSAYTPGVEGDVPNRFYVRRYLKYSSNLANPGNGKWFVQHEFKNTSCDPARRLTLYWHTNSEGEPYYRLRMDHANSMDCGIENPARVEAPDFTEQTCYPTRGENCPAFITGQWFYDEYFVQYSTGGTSSDRIAYAINGQVIFDYRAPVRTAKARGIKLTPGFMNIPNVEVQVDDLEIYQDAPCRTFPCGAPSHH